MNFNEIELFDKFPENILDMLSYENVNNKFSYKNFLSGFYSKLSKSGANFLGK